MLGSYFPSLPRVLEILKVGTQIDVVFGTAPGEDILNYINRLGPLPVGLACIMVWRIATEYEALESLLPEAATFLDPLSCRVGLWQKEFLHLFADRFKKSPLRRDETASHMLRLCFMLINGNSSSEINDAAAARVPSMLLTRLRELQSTGRTGLTLTEIREVMLLATAAVTRELRGSNMVSQLISNKHWHPLLPEKQMIPHVYEGAEKSCIPSTSVRLSRILAHRNRLTQNEVRLILSRLRELASSVPVLDLVLDPERIILQLPGIRDNGIKMLDRRLDTLPDFSVALESALGCRSLGRSPIAFREAIAPGHSFSDLRGDADAQCSRLWHTLQDGTYSVSGYNIDSPPSIDLPGRFFCSLVSPLSPVGTPITTSQVALPERVVTLSPPLSIPSSTKIPKECEPELSTAKSREFSSVSFFNNHFDRLPQRHMKIILITTGSGGTGKSTLARLIFELAGFDARNDVAMYDCDALGNRDFQKISPERIESMPIDKVDSMRRMVETAMEGKLVLADLPASCQDVLARDLNPEIIQSLREDDGLHCLPIHIVTAKAASVPSIKQWRTSVFGEAPSIIVVNLKDGPISSELLDEVVRPQDLVLRIPVLDQSLASALDASNSTWQDILDGKAPDSHRMFGNPLVKRQLRFKRKECEDALFPLLRRIVKDVAASN